MPWVDHTNSIENIEYQCSLFMRLIKDDTSEEVGSIMQFNDGAPFYAISNEIGRLGPHETLDEAKHAVEHHCWENCMVLAIPPTEYLNS